ncbi:MAG: Wzz/FepE/Etk N-terminal domain-containing protein [Bacteroidaceae bacterium]|nr:Wzz/FepE/Etk N-terminal domain-containing protein [Bacteroidaceae bacterium]
METTKDISNRETEQSVDLIALVKRLWSKLAFIARITIIFMFVGLFVALFSAEEYTASTTFVPQTSSQSRSSSVSNLAALAGINLNNMSGGQTLSPLIYPQFLQNVNFQLELINTPLKFEDFSQPISLLDYYTNPQYSCKANVVAVVKKYTIGLPFLILKALRPKTEFPEISQQDNSNSLVVLSTEEYECIKHVFENCVSVNLNEKQGYITLTANMPERLAAAQLTQAAYDLMQKYIVSFKLNKAKEQLNYINNALDSARADFENKQLAYAKFRDANRLTTSAEASIEMERLSSEYNLANATYTQLSQQQVQANLQLQEDTPILSQVKPVQVPYRRSKPQRSKMLVTYTFLGLVIGCAMVLGLDWLKKQNVAWPKKWKGADADLAAEPVPGISNPFKKNFWRAVFGIISCI